MWFLARVGNVLVRRGGRPQLVGDALPESGFLNEGVEEMLGFLSWREVFADEGLRRGSGGGVGVFVVQVEGFELRLDVLWERWGGVVEDSAQIFPSLTASGDIARGDVVAVEDGFELVIAVEDVGKVGSRRHIFCSRDAHSAHANGELPLFPSGLGEINVKPLLGSALHDAVKLASGFSNKAGRGGADGKGQTGEPQAAAEESEFNLGVVDDVEFGEGFFNLLDSFQHNFLAEASAANASSKELKTLRVGPGDLPGDVGEEGTVGGIPQLALGGIDPKTNFSGFRHYSFPSLVDDVGRAKEQPIVQKPQ